jgi:hypothetical protein
MICPHCVSFKSHCQVTPLLAGREKMSSEIELRLKRQQALAVDVIDNSQMVMLDRISPTYCL